MIIFGAKAVKNSHFGAFVRVSSGIQQGCAAHTGFNPICSHPPWQPGAVRLGFALGQGQSCWLCRKGHPDPPDWVNADLLPVLTRLGILQEGVWCQILYLTTTADCRGYECYWFYFFFFPSNWSFLLTLFNLYHGRPHFSLREVCGFFYSSVTCTPLLHCFTNHFLTECLKETALKNNDKHHEDKNICSLPSSDTHLAVGRGDRPPL